MKIISKNIKQALKESGLSQKNLGLILGVKQNTISQYCNNINEPDLETFYKICIALKVSPNELFGWEEDCLYSFEYNHNDTRLVHKEKK